MTSGNLWRGNMIKDRGFLFVVVCLLLSCGVALYAAQLTEPVALLTAKRVAKLPEIDGLADPLWDKIPGVEVVVKSINEAYLTANPKWRKGPGSGIIKVQLKAVHDGESISFLAIWRDSTKDDKHVFLVWDKNKKEYVEDKSSVKEDRFVFAFGITDNFCGCMIVPEDTINDIWHWKAYRTNEFGYLDDKRHMITTEKALRATRVNTLEGRTVWLRRRRDIGVSPYYLTDLYEYQRDRVPKYTLRIPSGSAADVTGKGHWMDGVWTLETRRKLDTGNSDDVVFAVGKKVRMAVSVFNRTDDHNHSVSKVIELDLE